MKNFKQQVCVYLFYPSINNPQSIYYLEKNKPDEPILGKLIGFGGNFEKGENSFSCAKRELEEELGLIYEEKDLFLQGMLYRYDLKRKIYLMRASLETKIPEQKIENEGTGIYKPLNYHKINPEMFMENDLLFLDALINNQKFTTFVYINKKSHLKIIK